MFTDWLMHVRVRKFIPSNGHFSLDVFYELKCSCSHNIHLGMAFFVIISRVKLKMLSGAALVSGQWLEMRRWSLLMNLGISFSATPVR